VIREVREETGLIVVVERMIGVYGKPGRNELVFAFLCRITGGTLQQTNESDDTAYYVLEEMPRNTLLRHAERVWDAIQNWDQPVVRRQGGPRRPENETRPQSQEG
jgi:ADP-ribose pyrophosphatase YjhB (NUDIX family)